MVKRVSSGLTNVLIRNKITNAEQNEIISFGIETAIYKLLHLSVAVLIGMMFGKVLEIIVFHLFYQKLRTYAGGHHAKSSIVCFISSCCIAVGTLTFWSLCPVAYKTLCMIAFLSISIPTIWLLSPVEAANKPLDEAETKVYHGKAKVYLLTEIIIVVVLQIFGFGEIALVGATALFTISIMLVLGKLNGV